MSDEYVIPCTFCTAHPKKTHWQQSKIKIEVFGSTMEYRVCPECKTKLGRAPCTAWKLMNEAFTKVRDELAERIK